jgi:hypothetical protein
MKHPVDRILCKLHRNFPSISPEIDLHVNGQKAPVDFS